MQFITFIHMKIPDDQILTELGRWFHAPIFAGVYIENRYGKLKILIKN